MTDLDTTLAAMRDQIERFVPAGERGETAKAAGLRAVAAVEAVSAPDRHALIQTLRAHAQDSRGCICGAGHQSQLGRADHLAFVVKGHYRRALADALGAHQ